MSNKVAKYDRPGQPSYYKNVEEMQIAIDNYFKDCDGEVLLNGNGDPMLDKYNEPIMYNKKPYTVTGLALALGFTSRQALINYQCKDEYFDTIVRAKLKCQQYAETRLFDKEGSNGAKFSLSNNFGWVDRQVIDNNNNNINGGLDLSALSIEEIKTISASLDRKLIEADYTNIDE